MSGLINPFRLHVSFLIILKIKGVPSHDTATGKLLFQTRLPAPLDGSPITYAVRGRQYIAVGTRGTARRPGNAIYTFALPKP